jgi:glycerol-3-phosphate dehydrogenase (NAD(P)+)
VDSTSNRKISVLGGGSFGSVIANIIAANGFSVRLWVRDDVAADRIRNSGENEAYLPGYKLSSLIEVTSDLRLAVESAETIFFAVPSSAFRDLAEQVNPWLAEGVRVVSAAKGIETNTFLLPSEVLQQTIPSAQVGVISGPNLAREIANGEITATVVSNADEKFCQQVQELLVSPQFRVYTNYDQYGVELAGALKNIYAIAAGITHAMGAGHNTKSLMLTRSLAEMSRFAVSMGANPMTFLGLSGIGDLYVTCSSSLSRNFRIGEALGNGMSLQQAISEVGQIAEGVNTTKLVKQKADQLGIYMPLASALYTILFEQGTISDSIRSMMVSEQNLDVDFMVEKDDR